MNRTSGKTVVYLPTSQYFTIGDCFEHAAQRHPTHGTSEYPSTELRIKPDAQHPASQVISWNVKTKTCFEPVARRQPSHEELYFKDIAQRQASPSRLSELEHVFNNCIRADFASSLYTKELPRQYICMCSTKSEK